MVAIIKGSDHVQSDVMRDPHQTDGEGLTLVICGPDRVSVQSQSPLGVLVSETEGWGTGRRGRNDNKKGERERGVRGGRESEREMEREG